MRAVQKNFVVPPCRPASSPCRHCAGEQHNHELALFVSCRRWLLMHAQSNEFVQAG